LKRKLFLVVLFSVLVILLSGCSGVVTPVNDEAAVKSVIHEYFLAINDQNWSKAKGYLFINRINTTPQVDLKMPRI